MSETGYFNLPWPILVHSAALTALGLAMAFSRTPGPSPELRGANSLIGITTATIGLAYLSTSGVPIEQNQFLYASVPVRLLIAVLLATSAIVNQKAFDAKSWRTHIGFALWDGIGALWLGWHLNRWDGRCPSI
ncbi:hypothetical protein H072_5808 [Dactylellina haptotyla CBS 200.50]|uniref:Uncharacterized protein n=1 Tax=Dactylellina haptotyla (strain CBS 200.50) TaxID=1284197 RepID=S8ABV7_DACHA|nr:hypothetical protein H072_5808 [Dactylellina haptotyla CBS 200.50]